MRWKKWVAGLALLLATAVGCKQQVFMTKEEYEDNKIIAISGLQDNPGAVDKPITGLTKAPPVTSDPEREIRYISLAECISIALEQGSTGSQFGGQIPILDITGGLPAVLFESLGSFSGTFNASPDAIRVLRLDPATAGAAIESALSRFDAVWSNSATWNTTDRPVGTSLDTFQSAGTVTTIEQQQATISTGIIKPLSTGGVAGITFDTAYTKTNLPAAVNPAYQPTLQFTFEQPLLQGFGTEINELRAASPGSILHPGTFNTQPTAEGILVTRLRFDQARAEFERNVHYLLLNTELAYWNLYASYWNLYATESGLKLAYETWRIFDARYRAGSAAIQDLAQARGNYELFRAQRLQALNQVLEGERQLRAMLNLNGEDGKRLVPSDEPTLAPYMPDWTTSLQEALTLKPELVQARQEVKAAQMNLKATEDSELPDVRLTASYDFNDIGDRLDGPGTENAFRNLSSGRFSDWSVGIQGNIPIGFRDAHAKTRVAKLHLARTFEVVRDQELKVQRILDKLYRQLDYNFNQVAVNRAQREAFGQQIRALAERVKSGKDTPDSILIAQRLYVPALQAEYNAIAGYNQALVAWEWTKGTIMQHDNVVISEGMLPGTAQARAVEHQRERTKAIVVRERQNPLNYDPLTPDGGPGVLPKIPTTSALSLPQVLGDATKLPPPPELPNTEKLPPPPELPNTDASSKPTEAAPQTLPSLNSTSMAPKNGSDFGAARPTDKSLLAPPTSPTTTFPTSSPVQTLPPQYGPAPTPSPAQTLAPQYGPAPTPSPVQAPPPLYGSAPTPAPQPGSKGW
jgi:outer membrane protein TolC